MATLPKLYKRAFDCCSKVGVTFRSQKREPFWLHPLDTSVPDTGTVLSTRNENRFWFPKQEPLLVPKTGTASGSQDADRSGLERAPLLAPALGLPYCPRAAARTQRLRAAALGQFCVLKTRTAFGS